VFTIWDAVVLPSTRNLVVAAAIAVAVAAATASGVLLASPTYQSRVTLAIDQPTAIARSADSGVIEKLDRLRLKYAGLVDTAPIAGEVSGDLRLKLDDVRDRVSVGIGPESLLLFPTAQGDSKVEAERLAQAIADRLRSYAADEQERDGIPTDERFVLEQIEPATSGDKIAPTKRAAVALGGFAALVALGGAYVGLQLWTARRRLT
jgi:capsular polysaccharide biosynthesis protein